jgi:hypothetical protein
MPFSPDAILELRTYRRKVTELATSLLVEGEEFLVVVGAADTPVVSKDDQGRHSHPVTRRPSNAA